jgi:hypothetical protein
MKSAKSVNFIVKAKEHLYEYLAPGQYSIYYSDYSRIIFCSRSLTVHGEILDIVQIPKVNKQCQNMYKNTLLYKGLNDFSINCLY